MWFCSSGMDMPASAGEVWYSFTSSSTWHSRTEQSRAQHSSHAGQIVYEGMRYSAGAEQVASLTGAKAAGGCCRSPALLLQKCACFRQFDGPAAHAPSDSADWNRWTNISNAHCSAVQKQCTATAIGTICSAATTTLNDSAISLRAPAPVHKNTNLCTRILTLAKQLRCIATAVRGFYALAISC